MKRFKLEKLANRFARINDDKHIDNGKIVRITHAYGLTGKFSETYWLKDIAAYTQIVNGDGTTIVIFLENLELL
jgi:hypothetical protein